MSTSPVWPAALTVGILLGLVALFVVLGAVRAHEGPVFGPVPSPAPAPGPVVLLEAGGTQ